MIIKTPVMLDTSHYETIADFAKVSPKPLFVITKATEGTAIVDPKFATYWADLKQDGIARGAYHFFRKALNIAAQAALFIKTVKAGGVSTSDIFVLDVEETGVSASQIIAWLDAVEAEFGNLIMIYSRKNILDPIAVTTTQAQRLRRYPVWTAGYPTYPDNFTQPPAAYIPDQTKWGEVWAWQYTDKGIVSGISGEVDLNWMSQALINRVTPQQPSPDAVTLAEIKANIAQIAGAIATLISQHGTILSDLALLKADTNTILDNQVNGGGTTTPPAQSDGYTGPRMGVYEVIDVPSDPINQQWTNGAVPLFDDNGGDRIQIKEQLYDLWMNTLEGFKELVDSGTIVTDEKGLRFILGKAVKGQKLLIAAQGKSDGVMKGMIVGFSNEDNPLVGAVNFASCTPETTPWLFNKVKNVRRWIPIMSGNKGNNWWIPMSWLKKVS